MKKILIMAAMMLAAVTAFAQTGKSIYQKYSDADDVSAVYISPAMFKLMGKLPDLPKLVTDDEAQGVNLASIIQSLSGFYLISSKNSGINAKLKADADKFVSGGKFELLMEVKDSGQTVKMFTDGSDKVVNGFTMVAVDGDETTFVCLDGKINRTDLEGLLNDMIK